MKVLHLNEHLDWKGGVETYLLGVLPLLEGAGVKSLVACAEIGSGMDFSAIIVTEIKRYSSRDLGIGYTAVGKIIKEYCPDLVHVHNVQNVGAVRAALELAPTVVTHHDFRYLCPSSTLFQRRTLTVCGRICGPLCFVKAFTSRCLTPRPGPAIGFYRRTSGMISNASRFSLSIAPSGAAGERLQRAGYPVGKIRVIPYFCPLPPAEKPRKLPSRATVTFIGRVNPTKGYQVLMEALGMMRSGARGLIVGVGGPAQERIIRDLARRYSCEERIEVQPWLDREKVPELMKKTTVLVFPSLWPETLGIVGLEAMAHGVPVVASNIGGVREWLEPDVNGLLVPPGGAAALAEALEEVLSMSPDRQLQMGTAGIDTIRKRFLPNQHLDSLLTAYREAAGHS